MIDLKEKEFLQNHLYLLKEIVWACGCFEKGAKNPELWRGENLLGHILMSVRKKLL